MSSVTRVTVLGGRLLLGICCFIGIIIWGTRVGFVVSRTDFCFMGILILLDINRSHVRLG